MDRSPDIAHQHAKTKIILAALLGGLVVLHGATLVAVTLGMFAHQAHLRVMGDQPPFSVSTAERATDEGDASNP